MAKNHARKTSRRQAVEASQNNDVIPFDQRRGKNKGQKTRSEHVSTPPEHKEDVRFRNQPLKCKTKKQEIMAQLIEEQDVVIATGEAGTGKTHVAIIKACEAFVAGKIQKIILTRPAIEADEENMGFLPGELSEKFAPYLAPYMAILTKFFGEGPLNYHLNKGNIEPIPLAFVRGMTLEQCVVLLDEAQNTTPKQMKTLLTRIGEFGKLIINGDLTQCDLPRARLKGGPNGLVDAVRRFRGVEGFGLVHFVKADIVRSALCQRVVDAYAEDTLAVAEQIGATVADSVYGGMLDAAKPSE